MCEKFSIINSNRNIVATLYKAKGNNLLIIASATGVKQTFYRKFAEFISNNGVSVITFDYSGIGLSLDQPIDEVKSSASEWGSIDLEAIITDAQGKFPNSKITLLGHSIGGQLIGFAKSSLSVQKIILVSAQSGYWKFWKGFSRSKMWFNWHLFFPSLIRLFNYLPSKKIGGMENLPKNVVAQRSYWGRNPDYLFHEFSEEELYFKNIKTNITAISVEDDIYAPKEAVDWLTKKYKNANVKELHLESNQYNVKEIGHFGFFREKFKKPLWEILLNELEE